MKKIKRISALFLFLIAVFILGACRASLDGSDYFASEPAYVEDKSPVSDESGDREAGSGITEEAGAGEDEAEAGSGISEEAGAAGESAEAGSGITEEAGAGEEEAGIEGGIAEDGSYTSKEDVALYLHIYGHLPSNFITKKEAKALGWSGGGLDDYLYGACIGGDRYSNFEGTLPSGRGITYQECDINTLHKSKRGPERLVFSSDGKIYYTHDHYNTFELLYE